MEKQGTDRAWTSFVVAQLARAAVGLIGTGVRALGCEVEDDLVVVHVVQSNQGTFDSEDVSDIAFELDVLLDGKVSIETVVHSPEVSLDWAKISPVYVAKP